MTLVEYITGLLTGPQEADAAVQHQPTSATSPRSAAPAVDGGQLVVYECRRCGTTVSAETTRCPACGRCAIAEYPVS